jgi:hypothetical protein
VVPAIRQAELNDLKRRLIEGSQWGGDPVVLAIQGMGGVGKTTTASLLARDPEVQSAFRDGVLWVHLGPNPELLPLLAGWLGAVGDPSPAPTDPREATLRLRARLEDRAALLVIDDAWFPEHVQPFLVGGPRCRTLITIRDAGAARSLGARLIRLRGLTPEQALALIEGRLGHPLEGEERDRALRVAAALGYNPSALLRMTALIAVGYPWEEVPALIRDPDRPA